MCACRAGVAVKPNLSDFEVLRLNAEANNCLDKVSLLYVGDVETTITLREVNHVI